MKRCVSLFLASLSCILLVSCSPEETQDARNTISIGAIYNQETGTTLSLGMTKDQVDELLGNGLPIEQPEEIAHGDYETYMYGQDKNELEISYLNAIAAGFSFAVPSMEKQNFQSSWRMKYGLTIGSTRDEMFWNLGEQDAAYSGVINNAPDKEKDFYGYVYNFDRGERRLTSDDNLEKSVYNCVITVNDYAGKILTISLFISPELRET